jgi:hypothetical protein
LSKEKTFFKKFVGWILVNRGVEWLSIILAIVSLTFSFAVFFKFEKIEGAEELQEFFTLVFASLVGLVALVLLLVIWFAQRNGKLADEQKDFKKLEHELSISMQNQIDLKKSFELSNKRIADLVHTFSHYTRDIHTFFVEAWEELVSIDSSLDNKERLESLKRNATSEFFRFSNHIVTNTKNFLDILTKDECSVSIKFFEANSDSLANTEVRTFLRDSVHERTRSAVDVEMKTFYAFQNTAFKEILTDSRVNYYFSNNLSKEKEHGRYKNRNAEWEKYYNACLVSALVFTKKSRRGYNQIEDENINKQAFGALCVDNMLGGFDQDITHNYLAHISDLFSSVYGHYSDILNKIEFIQKSNT